MHTIGPDLAGCLQCIEGSPARCQRQVSRSLCLLKNVLILWRFTPLSTVFQQYFGDSSRYSSFLGFTGTTLKIETTTSIARKAVNRFPNKPLFLHVRTLGYKSFENAVGKGDIDHNEQFFLFQKRFLSFWRTFRHFHEI